MAALAEFFEAPPRNWRPRLAVAVDLMRELSRLSDPEELLAAFTRRMGQLYPTDRQLSLSRRGLAAPDVRVTRFNLWVERVNPWKEPHRLPVFDRGLFSELMDAGEPRVIDELHLAPNDPARPFLDGQRSLLAIPLFEDGEAVTMVVCTREKPSAFPREQVPDLVWMCNLFSRATQSLVQSDALREAHGATDYELAEIASLQKALLPAGTPRHAGLDLAVVHRTAESAGGDYFDFFPMSDGRLGVLIADVSGHGTLAAVLMAITHSLAHAMPEPARSPAKMLGHLNEQLSRQYTKSTGSFVTAFYGVIDPAAGTLTYASAGHPPPRLARSGAAEWQSLPQRTRLPLGVSVRAGDYPEATLPFGPGDRLALYTDGIVDTLDAAGDPFGPDRLDGALGWAGPSAGSAEAAREAIGAVDRFAADQPPGDDQTLLVVRRTAEAAARPLLDSV